MSFDNRIGALILAAGSSSRMGQSKQLLDVEGEKLIVKVARAVLHAGVQNVSIVLGAHEADHRKALRDIPVHILSNPEWEKGMGSSIKTGLRHYMNDHRIEAMMVAVCDQPLLSTDIIRNLILCQVP